MSSVRTPPAHVPPAHVPLSQPEIHKIFYGLMLGGFLSAVNQTIVATALPTIGRDLGDFHNLSWVIIAYLLSSTVVAPLYGKLSDIHGRRAMMLAAIGLFIAGSAASAAAPNMALLIAGRTLQGIGGGGIVPLVQTTIADMVTPRERGRYQAYMGTSWIVAGLGGPALGAVLGLTVYLPLYFQVVHGLSAVEAGLALIPIVVMTVPGSMLSGRSMMHLTRYKVSAIAGGIIAIAAAAAMVRWPAMPLAG